MNIDKILKIGKDIAHEFLDYLAKDNIVQPFTQYSDNVAINIGSDYYENTDECVLSIDICAKNKYNQKLVNITSNRNIRFFVTELTPDDLSAISYLKALISFRFTGEIE